MTKFVPVLLAVAGLALAGTAGAATPAAAPAAKAKTVSAASAKRTSCEAEWKAQTHHKGGHKAFIKACVAKG